MHVKGRLWAECLGALLKWVRREVLAQILQCLGIPPAAAMDLVFLAEIPAQAAWVTLR